MFFFVFFVCVSFRISGAPGLQDSVFDFVVILGFSLVALLCSCFLFSISRGFYAYLDRMQAGIRKRSGILKQAPCSRRSGASEQDLLNH